MFSSNFLKCFKNTSAINRGINLQRYNKRHMSQFITRWCSNKLQKIQEQQQCHAYFSQYPQAELINKKRICLILLPLTSSVHSSTSSNIKATPKNNDVSNIKCMTFKCLSYTFLTIV